MPSEFIPTALRHRVREQANGRCEYCRSSDDISNASFHCDHILPRNAGGKTELANLAWACPWCNTHKHTKNILKYTPVIHRQVGGFYFLTHESNSGNGISCRAKTLFISSDAYK